MARLMDRLGPTVDLYVQTLIEENQRLQRQRDTAQKRVTDLRVSRDKWKAKAQARLREPASPQQAWGARYRAKKAAA